MRTFLLSVGTILASLFYPMVGLAASPALTYQFKHFIFTIPASEVAGWNSLEEMWTLYGQPTVPPPSLRVDGDTVPPLPVGYAKSTAYVLDDKNIRASIERIIAKPFHREPGTVTISKTSTGSIRFDGVGFPGRNVDVDAAVALTRAALEQGSMHIELPVTETPPHVTVKDKELRDKGITELVTIGESDFTGSTRSRIHNITVGLAKFQGHIIEKDETFSFVKVLGKVDGSTGYVKELTIIGDKTLPDFGGGLCQVSTTAYRGIWEYGFPIKQRRNHSFAVHYYGPQGTDATIYPPHTDMKFTNDSPGALLMQTYMQGTEAYFLYYGTKDNRKTQVIGPFSWGIRSAPPPRTEYTTEIPVGTSRKVGEATRGMNTVWFRILGEGAAAKTEVFSSIYEARPLYWQIGIVGTGSALGTDAEIDPGA